MKYPKDRFDDFPSSLNRRGAHRAPRTRLSKIGSWLIALASVVLLVGIGVGVMWMIDRQVQFSGSMGDPTPTPTETAQESSETPTPTPEAPVATFDAQIAVSVLNGAGLGGLATAGSGVLEGEGWNVQVIDDADHSNYESTTVAVNSEADLGAALAVVEALGFGEAIVDPAQASPGELIVILGADAAGLLN
ncbi:LytR family transcriptional regulator [Gulosibacter macacae]|uniref:LytR family transcriptional regulator n=1 Tax=Gulosibacter macacae TaxID=2488791 RepID=A0A3P3VXR9_9MICO|nr:LytR C-terminal domain-containing protein [Gulosibacter macacae]RRJ87490.1 LytR family transcriptional regulator [Gulosibacter macacae]